MKAFPARGRTAPCATSTEHDARVRDPLYSCEGNLSATFVARPETAEQNTVEGGEVAGACHRGLLLPSGGRDLELEAGLIEKLGRLVCEGALIEVVDIHKEASSQSHC